MTLSELKKQVDELVEMGHGELPVRVYADHGQVAMDAESIDLDFIKEDDYMGDLLHPDDYGEYPDKVPIICLG